MKSVSKIVLCLGLATSVYLAGAQQPPSRPVPAPNRPVPNVPGVPPGQGKADITNLKKGIIIGGAVGGAGGTFVPWGTTVDLSGVDPLPGTYVAGGPATVAQPGRCAFNVTYDESNIGAGATSPLYTNRLKLIGPTDVAVNTGRHLNIGETKTVTTQPYLTEGSNALMLYLDDGNVVAESNEGNNFFSIKYRLKCKQPGHPNPTPTPTPNPNGNPTGGPVGNCDGQPDLVPILPNPMSGTVMVKNIGKCPAGPSKLTLDCHKAGVVGGGGGCPEIPATASAPYHDPMFPDNVTINVPGLAPGASFSHTLAFWGAMKWTTGTYSFVGKADAANTVAESNEGNNVTNSTLVVP